MSHGVQPVWCTRSAALHDVRICLDGVQMRDRTVHLMVDVVWLSVRRLQVVLAVVRMEWCSVLSMSDAVQLCV